MGGRIAAWGGLLIGAAAGAPAPAQQVLALPQGCSAHVTVQQRGCIVSHLFRCAADPEGHQRRIDPDGNGIVHAGVIDAEMQWIESWQPLAGVVDRLEPGAADPASLSALLATGRDSFDFAVRSEPGGAVTFCRGTDRLTGERVTIDGVTLERTAFEATARDSGGAELFRIAGNEYVHRDWRTFLSGTRTTVTPDGRFDSDHSPVAFIFPGEPGFLASTPRHDCSVMMSSVPPRAPVDPSDPERM
jgi:hypothetical protein